jgi:alkylation response protein AidB-like acyl-CoA dehydrogenase
MDVRLSPEQRALRDSVARAVADLGPDTVLALDDEARADKLDSAIDAAGWRELRTGDPDRDGRAPYASAVEAATVAEELSRGGADAPFLGPTLAAELRRRVGAPAPAEPETVVLFDRLGSLIPSAAGADHDRLAVDAAAATAALVVQPAAHGHALGHVALGPPAIRTDLTRATAPVAGGVVAPVDGQQRTLSPDDLDAVTALGLALTSAELVGSMRGAVALATGYAKDRRQYGAPIGSFQAVQHLLADALVATEGSHSVALHAAWAVDALPAREALAAAATAKAYASRASRSVCEAAIQVHGGIGNTWECFAHVHLRRALLATEVFGGVGPNLERVLASRGVGHGVR